MRDASLKRLNLKRLDTQRDANIVVLGVHGTNCLTVLVYNSVVVQEGLYCNGVAVPLGTTHPVFEIPGSACCPGVQGMLKTRGYGTPGGAYGLGVDDAIVAGQLDKSKLRSLHPDSKFGGIRVYKSDATRGKLLTVDSTDGKCKLGGPPNYDVPADDGSRIDNLAP